MTHDTLTDAVEAKHTPGPWKVGGVDDYIWIEPPDSSQACICDLVQSGFDKRTGEPFHRLEDKANARLIAAAPDLLAELSATLDWLSSFSMPPTSTNAEKQERIAAIEAVIGKAAGR